MVRWPTLGGVRPGLLVVAGQLRHGRAMRQCESVWPEENRGKCFGTAALAGGGAEGPGSRRFSGAPYGFALACTSGLDRKDLGTSEESACSPSTPTRTPLASSASRRCVRHARPLLRIRIDTGSPSISAPLPCGC